jgi:hypothetical protein
MLLLAADSLGGSDEGGGQAARTDGEAGKDEGGEKGDSIHWAGVWSWRRSSQAGENELARLRVAGILRE